jgi:sugar fermentation stimulation protein A
MRLCEGDPVRATFINRPNRFVVNCEIDGSRIAAYLPNPGRLWELLFPGVTLLLSRNTRSEKLPYTVLALEKDGIPILLHTHKTNDAAEWLIRERLIPGLEDAVIVRREATFGESRFDFLLERQGRPFILEVKNCTLFWGRLAMFPDALTDRGSRHILHLAGLARDGMGAGVLFIVNWPHARFFMPEHHTDLAFCQNLLKVRSRIMVKAVAVSWEKDLTLGREVRDLEIPWEMVARYERDRGSYIVALRLDRDRTIRVGESHEIAFRKGFYLYVGSAKRGLTARTDRHRRLTKAKFWHIDYLREHAEVVKIFPVRGPEDLECRLAEALRPLAGWSVKGFGSSDCTCESHLFGMEENPLDVPAFIDMLYDFRMGRIEREFTA